MGQGRYSTPSYAYALSNPLRYTDPTGLFTVDTRSMRACLGSNQGKWTEAYKLLQKMAKSPKCAAQFRDKYGVELNDLIAYWKYGATLNFGSIQSGWGAQQQGTTITVQCSVADTATPLGLALLVVHELAHYANMSAGTPIPEDPQPEHGGAKDAELECFKECR